MLCLFDVNCNQIEPNKYVSYKRTKRIERIQNHFWFATTPSKSIDHWTTMIAVFVQTVYIYINIYLAMYFNILEVKIGNQKRERQKLVDLFIHSFGTSRELNGFRKYFSTTKLHLILGCLAFVKQLIYSRYKRIINWTLYESIFWCAYGLWVFLFNSIPYWNWSVHRI